MEGNNPAWQEDLALAQRALAGNAAAFAQIVKTHQRLVWHMAWRMLQHRQEAEDCCQEVFLRVHQSLRQYRGESALGTWIGRVAFSVALRMAQKRKLRLDLPTDAEPELVFGHIGSGEDVQQAHAESEQLQALHAAIEQLPGLPRTVLSLHYRDGLQISEIAAMLDCPEGTIKSHLNRGRNRLKAALAHMESHYARL
ncbi:MAG TPA: RNA polymerase sigma factor [Arenimonas sp.]|nr:RNA polymerase sigma factor [Arenimonas sp.]